MLQYLNWNATHRLAHSIELHSVAFRAWNVAPTVSLRSSSICLNNVGRTSPGVRRHNLRQRGWSWPGAARSFARHIKLARHPSSALAKLNYAVRLERTESYLGGDTTHARVLRQLPGRITAAVANARWIPLSKNDEVIKSWTSFIIATHRSPLLSVQLISDRSCCLNGVREMTIKGTDSYRDADQP